MDERFAKIGGGEKSSNLLDFKIDSTSMQLFEGVDYKEKRARQDELKKMIEETRILNEVEASAERRQRAQKVNYDEKAHFREMAEAIRKASKGDPKSSSKSRSLNFICRKYNIPRPKEIPRIFTWMLLDVERVKSLMAMEQEKFAELALRFREYDEAVARGDVMTIPEIPNTLLPTDLDEELNETYNCPFLDWRRTDILAFVQATEQCGRTNYAGILSNMRERGCKNKTEDIVKKYSERFWTVGHVYLKKWTKYEARLIRAEEKNREIETLRDGMSEILSRYRFPYHQLALSSSLHPKTGHLEFTAAEDRFLAVWVAKNGFGRAEDLRREVRQNVLFQFDPIFLIRTGEELERRSLKVMRSCIKEHARLDSLQAEQSASADAAAAAMGANEIAKQVAIKMREFKRQFWNGESSKNTTKRKKRSVLSQKNTGTKTSTTKKQKSSKGVPSRLMGSLVKTILASKKAGIEKVVSMFLSKHSSADISKRQVRMKIKEVATKKTSHSTWIINEAFQKYTTPRKKRKTPSKSSENKVQKEEKKEEERDPKRARKLEMGGEGDPMSPTPVDSLVSVYNDDV